VAARPDCLKPTAAMLKRYNIAKRKPKIANNHVNRNTIANLRRAFGIDHENRSPRGPSLLGDL
jgi:hypothetical protein